MTPAIKALEKAKLPFKTHEYLHDPSAASYGLEAAEKMGVAPAQVFKTLVVKVDSKNHVVAVVPVSALLSMKHIARAAEGKKAAMADKAEVERITGYVVGGVSPLGQKKSLQTFIDQSAQAWQTIFISAGRRGLEIEISPQDLKNHTRAQFMPLSQDSSAL